MLTVSSLFAVGVGANVATFSALDQLVLAPPPGVRSPRQVRRLYERDVANPLTAGDRANVVETQRNFVFDQYAALRSFGLGKSIAAYFTATGDILARVNHETLGVTYTAGPYFSVLGVPLSAGRSFDASEASSTNPTTSAIVSKRFSVANFPNDRAAIGASIQVDGNTCTIVGVVGQAFRGLDDEATDVWLPIGAVGRYLGDPNWATGNRASILRIVTRAKTSVDRAALVRAATVVLRSGARQPDPSVVAQLGPLRGQREIDLDNNAQGLTILERLLGVSLAILLITCISVANLSTVRGLQRQREIAIRSALGATKAKLTRLLASEGVLACLLGGVAGTAVAAIVGGSLRTLVMTSAPDFPAFDWRVLIFAVALVGLGSILMSLIPLRLVRPSNIIGAITGTSLGGRGRSNIRQGLVVVQVALTMILLVGAGLFGRSFFLVSATNVGYDTQRTIVATVHPSIAAADTAYPVGLRVSDAVNRLDRLPAIEVAGVTSATPMSGQAYLTNVVAYADGVRPIQGRGFALYRSYVSADFFRAGGIAIAHGRPFGESDDGTSRPVVIVNQVLAQDLWGKYSPLGRCVTFEAGSSQCLTVVGVAANAHVSRVIESPVFQLYLPLSQAPLMWRNRRATIILARARDKQLPEATMEMRDSLSAWLSQFGTIDVKPMASMLAPELWPWRVGAVLFGAMSILASLVSILAIYSTMSYSWAQRRREVAVRLAVGATSAAISRQVLSSVLGVAMLGIGIGAVVAVSLGGIVESLLYHVSATDLPTFVASALVLILASTAAGIQPMLSARRTDVVSVLKSE